MSTWLPLSEQHLLGLHLRLQVTVTWLCHQPITPFLEHDDGHPAHAREQGALRHPVVVQPSANEEDGDGDHEAHRGDAVADKLANVVLLVDESSGWEEDA